MSTITFHKRLLCGIPWKGSPSAPVRIETQFSRCRQTLYLVATKVLGNEESAEEAVENCFVAASRLRPSFSDEAEFRRWLVRNVVDEALLILQHRKERVS